MKILIHILITALALLVVSQIIHGISVANVYTAIIAALIIGILNVLVKPILVVLTFPITILTLGLFIFVINAGLFMFAASFIEGFEVDTFISALIGSIIVSIVSTIGNKLAS